MSDTDLVPSKDDVALDVVKRLAPQSDNLIMDAVRVSQLLAVQELMRFELLTYGEALEKVGISRQMVHQWKQSRPYLSEAAVTLGVQQLDDEISSMLLAARPRIVQQLIFDAVHALKATARHSAVKLLHQYGYSTLDDLTERVEREMVEISKTGEDAAQAARPRRRLKQMYGPVLMNVGTIELPDGRLFPSDQAQDGDWSVVGDEEE